VCLWRSRGFAEMPGKAGHPSAQDEGQQVRGQELAETTRRRASTEDSNVE